jgi:hypothetical protein
MTSYLVLQASQVFFQVIAVHNHVQKEEEETKGLRMGQGVKFQHLATYHLLP